MSVIYILICRVIPESCLFAGTFRKRESRSLSTSPHFSTSTTGRIQGPPTCSNLLIMCHKYTFSLHITKYQKYFVSTKSDPEPEKKYYIRSPFVTLTSDPKPFHGLTSHCSTARIRPSPTKRSLPKAQKASQHKIQGAKTTFV